jgi:hypothetical protein
MNNQTAGTTDATGVLGAVLYRERTEFGTRNLAQEFGQHIVPPTFRIDAKLIINSPCHVVEQLAGHRRPAEKE